MRIFLCAALLAGPSFPEAAAQSLPSATPMPASSVPSPAVSSTLRAYALRLKPGQDLRRELEAFAQAHHLRAAAVLTCVGSLTTTSLRLANQEGGTQYHGHFEIVSLVGTLSVNGSHLHLSVADSTGRTVGGHLLEGSIVYTTAELVLGELPELDFRREPDATYGYQELTVYPAPKAPRRPAAPKKSR
ncbi:PPC domain-containing DNA-binding protein [Hymenobacter sp. HSC-4F20]|uniref:PPC domain-containing DNA-binding protein n=1 Tax=Hymenobacter sp. HSC-4F20 TaxID=2864135 RepID=UPI002176193A|nr:PPC domain-containing DNA-binding protein [Hymenobacter sp. HSC-4F20]